MLDDSWTLSDSTPQLMRSWRIVRSDGVVARIGAAGRNRAMALAVAPVRVQAMMAAAFSSWAARHAAAVIAAVMRWAEPPATSWAPRPAPQWA